MNTNSSRLGLRSFRPHVSLRDGKCSLKRHYRGASRQFIAYADMLASQDPERFVWASVRDIRLHCKKNFKTGELYSTSVVKQWKRILREQGVISEQVKRIRGGVLREGFILRGHDTAANTSANLCVLPMEFAAESAPVSSPLSAPLSAPVSAPLGDCKCTPKCTPECTSETPQAANESSEYRQAGKVSQKFAESSASPRLLDSKTIRQSDNETTAQTAVEPSRRTDQECVGLAATAAETPEQVQPLMSDDEKKHYYREQLKKARAEGNAWNVKLYRELCETLETGAERREREQTGAIEYAKRTAILKDQAAAMRAKYGVGNQNTPLETATAANA